MGLIVILYAGLATMRQALQRQLQGFGWRELTAMLWLVAMLPVFLWTGLAMLVVAGVLGTVLLAFAATRWLQRKVVHRRG